MEGLISRVLDERQPATLKWLAYHLKIPSSRAKGLLEEFVTKYEGDTSVNLEVTYLLAGKTNSESSHSVRLVSGQNLGENEREMQLITSKHVYAVSLNESSHPSPPLDIWNTDFENARKLAHDSGEWGASFLKNAFGLVSYPNVKIKAASRRISVAGSKQTQKNNNGGIKSLYDHTAKKIKGPVSASTFFGVSAGKNKSESKQLKTNKKETKYPEKVGNSSRKKDDKDIVIINKKTPETSEKTIVAAEPTQEVSQPGILQNKVPNKRRIIDSDDEDEEHEFGESNANVSNKNKKRKKIELSAEELEKREKELNEKKKQKREEIKEQRRAERERIKKAETEEAKARFAESLGVPTQAQPSEGKTVKRTKRVLKTQTYEDENGYLVTKDVWEEVEVEEIEEPQNVRNQVKPAVNKVKEIVINPVKKKVKQQNMMSFFKKKEKKI